MPRPVPTPIMHCTAVEHLASVVENGLMSDVRTRAHDVTQVELGDSAIKERRRRKLVPRSPYGTVGEYVPFYFAAHNSMMYSRHQSGYSFDRFIFLVSSLERLVEFGLVWLISDRNAAQGLATFAGQEDDLDGHVDWPLMRSTSWGRCAEDNERPDRRMAECLVHERVPWLAIERIVTKNQATASEVEALVAARDAPMQVDVGRHWYF